MPPYSLLTFVLTIALGSVSYAQRPNVLVILADDLGYSDLGCFGSEIPTPNIDSLAANGLRFTQCYNSARCCPSRASLMTGLYPHQTGIGSFATRRPAKGRGPAYIGHLNDRCVTLAEVLGGAGYQTYMVGKWHMEKPGPIARGFDEFYGFVQGYEQDQWESKRYQRLPAGRAQPDYENNQFYATDAFSDYALDFLSQARAQEGKPWFLYVAHGAPHFPVQAPAKTVDKHVDRYKRGWDLLRSERFERQRAIGLAQDSWILTKPSIVPVDRQDIANGFPGQANPPWDSLSVDRRADLARRMAVFAAMVDHIDQGVGRILKDLKKNRELDNTLILFLSDNGACYEWGPFGFDGPSRRGKTTLHTGEALQNMGGPGTYHAYGSAWSNLSNTPFRLYKHFTHEGGICTPLIAHWPAGIQTSDRWVRDPVHIMDIMPTLCEAAGANYPRKQKGRDIQAMEGASLIPAFQGERIAKRSLGFEHQEARAIRKGPWKAVWSKRMPNKIEWELYNLDQDRCESRNLANKHAARTAKMAKEWETWAKRVQVFPFFKPKR